MKPDARSWDGIRRTAQICAATSGGIALVMCGGWVFGRWKFATFGANYIPMAPSTALLLFILSVAVFARAGCRVRRANVWFATVAASLTFVTGLLLLSRRCLGLHTDFERWLSRTSETVGGVPVGRMSPVTAIVFLLVSVALFLKLPPLAQWRPARHLSAALDSVVMTGSLIIVLAYLYGTPLFYSTNTIPMALLTAVAFALLSLAIELSQESDSWFLSMFTGHTVYSQMARAFIPTILLLTILQNWLSVTTIPRLVGNQALYSGFIATAYALTSAILVWLLARRVGGRVEEAERMRHLSEKALRESEARYRTLFEQAPDGVFIADREGNYVDANVIGVRMLGYTRDELLRLRISDVVAEVEVPRASPELENIKAGQPYYREWQFKRKDDSVFIGEVMGAVMPDGNVLGILRDITERKRGEEALRKSEEQYRMLVDNMAEGLGVQDKDGRITFMNKRACQMLGYEPDELIGKPASFLFDEENQKILRTQMARRRAGERRSYEIAWRRKDGGKLDTIISPCPLFDDKGNWQGSVAVFTDITERKQMEGALRESQRRLQDILDAMYAFVGLFTPEGVCVVSNRAALEAGGLRREDVVGRCFAETNFWSHSPAVQEQIREAIRRAAQGETVRDDFAARMAGGVIVTVDGTFGPVRDTSGCVTYVVASGVNVSNRKQAEEALREREQQLRLFVEHSPAAIAMLDSNMRYMMVSNRWLTDYRLSEQHVIGRSHYEIFPEIPERWKGIHRRCLGGAVEKSDSDEFPRADGSTDWVRWEIRPWHTAQGDTGGLIIFSELITDHKLAADKIFNLNAKLEQSVRELTALNNLGNTVNASLSLDQVINAALGEIVGAVAPDLTLLYLQQDGKLVLRGARPVNTAQPHREIQLSVGECLCGLAARQETPVLSGNMHTDQRCTLDACKRAGLRSLAALPLISGGKVFGVLGFAWVAEREFGEQARFLETLTSEIAIGMQNALLYERLGGYATELEQRVAQRTAQLEVTNNDLESFSYSVSHDLRAPLRAISGFADIIARRHSANLNEEGRHYVNNIVYASDRMWRLIDDLLTYSRLGRRGVHREPVLLRDVFNQLADDLSVRLKGIGRTLNLADDLPFVIGDKTLLLQIFTNLLENAITYRRTDVPVQVTVTWRAEGKDVIIRVADNGIGIPSEHYEKIFNVFQRLHTEEEYPGTGIGLATVKKTVGLLGGSVWVESVVGEGSTFFVKLPKEEV